MKKETKQKNIKKVDKKDLDNNINFLDDKGVVVTCFFVVLLFSFFTFLVIGVHKSIYSKLYNLPTYILDINAIRVLWLASVVGGLYIIGNIIVFAGCKHGMEVQVAKVIMALYLIAICIGMVNFAKDLPYFKNIYEFIQLDNKEDKYIIIDNNKNYVIGMKYEMDNEGNVMIFANGYRCIKMENYLMQYIKLKNKPIIKK